MPFGVGLRNIYLLQYVRLRNKAKINLGSPFLTPKKPLRGVICYRLSRPLRGVICYRLSGPLRGVICYRLSVICSPYSEGGSFTELLLFLEAL